MSRMAKSKKRRGLKILALALSLLALPAVTGGPALAADVVDDFELDVLPTGTDGDGNTIGFYTFSDGASGVSIATTDTAPGGIPGVGSKVLQVDTNVVAGGFAGFIHAFENEALDTWVTQDWSAVEGVSFWLFGNNTGSTLFLDVLDNRNPGSTVDDAERYSIDIIDDFSGWQFFEVPFEEFRRKDVQNGAPSDGFTLTEIHGWAFGVFRSGQAFTNYIDDFGTYGTRPLQVAFSSTNFEATEGDSIEVVVKMSRPFGDVPGDPAKVTVDFSMEPGLATPDRDYLPLPNQTVEFVAGGSLEYALQLQTIDDMKYEGGERVILRLSNPVGAAPGLNMQAAGLILDNETYDPLLLDDFEGYPYLWDALSNMTVTNPEVSIGERVLETTVPLHVDIDVEGRFCNQGNGVIPVVLYTTDDFDATTVDHTTVRLGNASESHVDRKTGEARRHEEDVDDDGDIDLVFHFRFAETGLPCDSADTPLTGFTYDDQAFAAGAPDLMRDFPIGQDWSFSDNLSFLYYGTGSGDEVTVHLKDNRAPDPGPAGWEMAWSEEYDEPAGTPPNPDYWSYEIGDGVVNGIPGWGNDEFQYYTDDPANAATDGNGNMVFTVRDADGSLQCYYGPCEYTSARLISSRKAEFAYGRIESRILVPDGEAGLWPAFWSLGTDIGVVGWPQTGEIDFMEYVSRLPNEIFGTIHGPGYSGGQSFNGIYDFGVPVYDDYHTFAIEWEPDLIKWYVDDILYHTATPANVAPNEWVFNDPVFLIYNVAIGGNFGGPIDPNLQLPQSMAVDYVRVYQAPDTAERFESTFVDDTPGWSLVEVALDSFTRSAEQPAGAPDDGLTLTDVWGYGFSLPDGSGSVLIDQVRISVPTVTVVNTDDSGPGSLREAIGLVPAGGVIDFDPSLAGDTIDLTSGPLVVSESISVDGSAAPGLSISGGGADRVLIVDPGSVVEVSHLTLSDGFGFQLAGCVLNNGALTLDHVSVTGCTMTTDGGDFWQGGGGIYTGDGGVLNLVDSTVSDNFAGWSGGGVYGFLNSTTNIERSTISGNVSNDVGGGLRLLGNANIVNSTISGNTATAWHGGGAFITDGVVDIINSTVTDNFAPSEPPPDGPGPTAGGLFVGTFTDASATLNLQNSIVAGNANFGCFLAPFGAGAVAINSLGNNVFTDATCNAIGTDQVVGSAGLGVLADNGGPTLTHALLAGSPAIDTADAGACPATDQRGVARPQGPGCDVGSFEVVP